MNKEQRSIPESTRFMLECLQEAVSKELERKRRLGHYAVFHRDGKVVLEGEDAPVSDETPSTRF